MNLNCQQFWSDRTFLNTVFPLVPQESSETALSHIFSQALDRWTLNNFPVFVTGVRIFRASNDEGPLFLGPGSTRILEINTK